MFEVFEKTVKWKALLHIPTGRWVKLDYGDAVYGFLEDGIERATLFAEDSTFSKVTEGVDFQFHQIDPDDFEMRDVEVTYRLKES